MEMTSRGGFLGIREAASRLQSMGMVKCSRRQSRQLIQGGAMNTSASETSKAHSPIEAQPPKGKGEQSGKAGLRWYTITPNRVLIALLVWTGFLYLSKKFVWFEFNHHRGLTVLIAVASLVVVVLAFGLWGLASWLWKLRTKRSAPAFQFSLATLLLFIPVFGITCSWFGKELRQARRQAAIVKALRGQGAIVNHDDSFLYFNPLTNFCSKWLIKDFFSEVISISTSDPTGLKYLKGLKQLQSLNLEGPSITDAGLEHLKGLKQLTQLTLYKTSITGRAEAFEGAAAASISRP